jgi:hypothetical protein
MAAPKFSAQEGTPNALPKGKASELNAMVQDVNLDELAPPYQEEAPAEVGSASPVPAVSGGIEQLVMRPSDRPHEPITQGVPFGPGSAERPNAPDIRSSKQRIYQELLTSPSSTPRTRALAARMMREGN